MKERLLQLSAGVLVSWFCCLPSATCDNVDEQIQRLRHPDSSERLKAVKALGEMKDARAAKALVASLKDRSLTDEVWEALGKIGAPAVGPLLEAIQDPNLRWQASNHLQNMVMDHLLTMSTAAAESVLAGISHSNRHVRATAAYLVGCIKDPRAVGPLLTALRDNDWRVNFPAQQSLAWIGAPAVPALTEALSDRSAHMRRAAVYTLGNIRMVDTNGVCALEPLLAALKSTDVEVRRGAVLFLGDPSRPCEMNALLGVVKDRDATVRAAAVRARGAMKDASAIKPLLINLRDPAPQVRCAAAQAVLSLGYRPATERERIDLLVTAEQWEELVKIGPPAVGPLLSAMRSPTARFYAIETLSKIKDTRAVLSLLAVLKDRDWFMRTTAAQALGNIRDDRMIKPMLALLKDSRFELRRTAVEALRKQGYEPANQRERIAFIMAGRDWAELAKMGAAAVPSLLIALKDDAGFWRARAAKVLGQIGNPCAVKPLVAALPDWDAKEAIAKALTALGWKPQTDRERVYLWICRGDAAEINKAWPLVHRLLLQDLRSGDKRCIEQAAFTYISLGREEMLPELVRLAKSHGKADLMRTYAGSNRDELQDAVQMVGDHTGSGVPKTWWGAWRQN